MNRVWIEEVRIERIKSDPRLQPRAEDKLDEWHVSNMPADVDARHPVDVFRVNGGGDVLAGGHYRLERVTREGRETIHARIHEGTWLDAFWFSRGENRDNAKERSPHDVRHAAFQAFDLRKTEEFDWFTDTKIADALHVTPQRVSQLRREWEAIESSFNGGQGDSEDEDGEETDSDALDRGEVEDGDDEEDEEEAAPSKPARKPRKKKVVLEPLPDLDFDFAIAKGAEMRADNEGADAVVLRHHFADHFRKCLQPALAVLAAQGLLAKHRKALERLYAEVRGE